MEGFIYVALLMFIIGGVVCLFALANALLEKTKGAWWFVLGIIIFWGGFIGGKTELDKYRNTPKALDVYRGKTSLQITYVDSVPTDTVVVFKHK